MNLFKAIRSGTAADLVTALKAGAEPNQVDEKSGETPLAIAARSGKTRFVTRRRPEL